MKVVVYSRTHIYVTRLVLTNKLFCSYASSAACRVATDIPLAARFESSRGSLRPAHRCGRCFCGKLATDVCVGNTYLCWAVTLLANVVYLRDCKSF